jgi:MinD-like ATPase involved in chromosome partitioning or flagellar assembly
MTVVTFGSIKGSPGVTTLACLVGATWPTGQRPMLIECDRSGGDLASRFSLSTRSGWTTLVAGVRRGEPIDSLQPHLQSLPGGLEVLVGPRHGDPAASGSPVTERVARTLLEFGGATDLLVDVGRFSASSRDIEPWLSEADAVCVVARSDAASIIHVHEHAAVVRERTHDRASLVLVGRGPYRSSEIERFTGLRVLMEVPDDPTAAATATTGRGSARRMARSGLVSASRRLATSLSGSHQIGEDVPEDGMDGRASAPGLSPDGSRGGVPIALVPVLETGDDAIVSELEPR